MKRLGPGVYADDAGVMHVYVGELLDGHGIADTPANREILIAAARDAFAARGIEIDEP